MAPAARRRGGGSGGPFGRCPTAQLTPEQKAQVQGIVATHRAASQALIEQLRQAQDELADKLLGPAQVGTADLRPQLQRIAQLREQILQDHAQAALEIRAILTPEQLSKAAQGRTA